MRAKRAWISADFPIFRAKISQFRTKGIGENVQKYLNFRAILSIAALIVRRRVHNYFEGHCGLRNTKQFNMQTKADKF